MCSHYYCSLWRFQCALIKSPRTALKVLVKMHFPSKHRCNSPINVRAVSNITSCKAVGTLFWNLCCRTYLLDALLMSELLKSAAELVLKIGQNPEKLCISYYHYLGMAFSQQTWAYAVELGMTLANGWQYLPMHRQLTGRAGLQIWLHIFKARNRCEPSVSALFLPITSGFGFKRRVFVSKERLFFGIWSKLGRILPHFKSFFWPAGKDLEVLESNSLYCKVLYSEEWLLSSLESECPSGR